MFDAPKVDNRCSGGRGATCGLFQRNGNVQGWVTDNVGKRQLSAKQHQRDVASHYCKTRVSNVPQEVWRTFESV